MGYLPKYYYVHALDPALDRHFSELGTELAQHIPLDVAQRLVDSAAEFQGAGGDSTMRFYYDRTWQENFRLALIQRVREGKGG